MNYDPADLTTASIEKLQQLEEELSTSTGEPIVLIAYMQQEESVHSTEPSVDRI